MTQPSGKIKKILIVEDNRLDQKAITKMLDKETGYQYTLAGTLKEAREKLKETIFDLVLLDANLPDGTTAELFDELAPTPFVITAGTGSEEYAMSACKAGAADYLIKDVDGFYLKLIPSTIEKVMQRMTQKNELVRFSKAVEQSASMVMITDVKGHIEYVNPKFFEITGYEKEKVIGANPRFLKSGKTTDEEYKRLWEAISSGKEWRGEMMNRKKNGEFYWALMSISPVRNEGGVITHFVGVQEDITARKKLEAMKDDFIGTVSHELRTPLTIIGLGLENLQAGILGPLTAKQIESVERNLRNAKRLGKMIDNLLDLSRLESGRAKIQQRASNLNSLIHEVLQSFQGVEEKFMKSLPEVDPDMISQVLVNLLSNASRYAKSKIVVTTNVIKNDVDISVFNDGPGISREKRDKLFEKFVQLDREKRESSYKGTGLGLAICKEIIEQHQGKIWIESEGEKGVTFHFTLPLSPSLGL